MTTQDVDPDTFYRVGKRLFELAGEMYSAFDVNVKMLGDTGAMAGSDDAGTAWASSYDTRVDEVLGGGQRLDRSAGKLRRRGHPGRPQPRRRRTQCDPQRRRAGTGETTGTSQRRRSALCATVSRWPRKGLIDNAIGLADQIGVPVPDGDTDKVDKAAQAWDRLATVYQTTNVVTALDVNADMFSDTKSPEVEFIAKDLGELRDATQAILDGCAELAQSCNDYRAALDELRETLEGILKDLAIELGATAAIGIAASFITFGVGAVAATAKTAHTITKFAKIITTAVSAWKVSKNIAKGVKKARDIAAIRQRLQRLKNLGRRKKGEEPKPPPPRKFPPSQANDKVPAEWGSGKPNNKGVGQRWEDPSNPGNGIRIDEGVPGHTFPSQQGDHVIVRVDGQVIGRDGKPISGSIKDNAENAHIPLEEWLQWTNWAHP